MLPSRNIQNVFLLLLINYWASAAVQHGQDCNDGAGECLPITECPIIANYLSTKLSSIVYCEQGSPLLCCPKKVMVEKRYNIVAHEQEISVANCIAYKKQVYQTCKPTGFIVGGTKVQPKELPHMALLGAKATSEGENLEWFCGGTLISRKHVLTAAHCLYAERNVTIVRLGEVDYDTSEDGAQIQDFEVVDVKEYHVYNSSLKYHDIAILELSREAELNEHVVPACLPLSNGTEFSKFIAAGWGSEKVAAAVSHKLLRVDLERFSDEECFERTEKNQFSFPRGVDAKTQICAGSRSGGFDTCQGDSGGPLFVQHPDHPCMFMVVGITSFGYSCGIKNIPGVYTRVNLYVDWIERAIWNAGVKLD